MDWALPLDLLANLHLVVPFSRSIHTAPCATRCCCCNYYFAKSCPIKTVEPRRCIFILPSASVCQPPYRSHGRQRPRRAIPPDASVIQQTAGAREADGRARTYTPQEAGVGDPSPPGGGPASFVDARFERGASWVVLGLGSQWARVGPGALFSCGGNVGRHDDTRSTGRSSRDARSDPRRGECTGTVGANQLSVRRDGECWA